MMKEAVGKWSADALMEQDEQESCLDALFGEAVAITPAIALQEAMGFHLADVVPELGQGVALVGQAVGSQYRLMDVVGAPACEVVAAVEQDFHQTDDPGVMDLDARDPALAEEDGQGEALEEGEIDVDVEGLGLGGGEALEDSEKGLAHLQQMVEPLPQGEIGQVVAADFHAEEGGKLLVLFDESV